MARVGKRTVRESPTSLIAEGLRQRALPLVERSDLEPLIARIGNAHYVLLGEAPPGTSEFYTWRTKLSQRLITEHETGKASYHKELWTLLVFQLWNDTFLK